MEITEFLDTGEDVSITYNSVTRMIVIKTYDPNMGWTEYEIASGKLDKFFRVIGEASK